MIVGIIRWKPVLTYASIIFGRHAGVGEFSEFGWKAHTFRWNLPSRNNITYYPRLWHGHPGLDIRRDLYWLPVSHHITFKLCLLTWKTLHTAHPPGNGNLQNAKGYFAKRRAKRSVIGRSGDAYFADYPSLLWVAATGAVGSHACSYSFITRRTQHRTTKRRTTMGQSMYKAEKLFE